MRIFIFACLHEFPHSAAPEVLRLDDCIDTISDSKTAILLKDLEKKSNSVRYDCGAQSANNFEAARDCWADRNYRLIYSADKTLFDFITTPEWLDKQKNIIEKWWDGKHLPSVRVFSWLELWIRILTRRKVHACAFRRVVPWFWSTSTLFILHSYWISSLITFDFLNGQIIKSDVERLTMQFTHQTLISTSKRFSKALKERGLELPLSSTQNTWAQIVVGKNLSAAVACANDRGYISAVEI